ncbi:MAG: T9SS type A sorting domain-containing protein [Lewinellaceae bacterium]|nr:T9SS type A sorting domain-containing protein [Lewinellaceae bacterium]
MLRSNLLVLFLLCQPGIMPVGAQSAQVDVFAADRRQQIDGFGAHQGGAAVNAAWWQQLYYDDLGASIYRLDLTPRLVSPYSDLSYFSPWFMGSATNSVFNLEDPDNPDGPEGNRVRTYTGPQDYSRLFGGQHAPIAVMGPDIDANVALFTYPDDGAIQAGLDRQNQLGDFKLIGSLWSPLPWVKVSSGNQYTQNWWPGPVANTPWPFVWGGNFAGGRLDVSGLPLPEFDDSALGGAGPTSALTQFVRSTAAYIRGFQQAYGVQFYAVSIQNELNFEQFYNSATYPLSTQYITALKAVRAEFDQYDDLKEIRIMGPEDLLGGDAYGLWEYGGGGSGVIHKNLQYLQNIAADPAAAAALDFFCIHGYDSDGASSAGAGATSWDRWANGWTASPAPGIPANVSGFRSFNKKSWMTETSGENAAWLFPANGFPNNGGWSIALKMHQALTTGRQSAWLYWTFSEDPGVSAVSDFALTSQTTGANSPKYVAAKHFFKYIRPDAWRVNTTVAGSADLLASAYVHDTDGTLTIVLVNQSASPRTANIHLQDVANTPVSFDAFTSANNAYWQNSTVPVAGNTLTVTTPGYGVTTLYGAGFISTGTDEQYAHQQMQLFQNQPNPFRAQTNIRFRVGQPARVKLTVQDETGRTVTLLADGNRYPGVHDVTFNAGDLPAGVYFCELVVEGVVSRKKMVLLK